MYVKTMFIHDELWANNRLLLISGVKSPLISYLLSREAIRGLKMAWDMRLVNIIYRYFKRDDPSHIWRNNTLTMTSNPQVGQVRQFYFFIFMLTSPWLRIYIYTSYHTMCLKRPVQSRPYQDFYTWHWKSYWVWKKIITHQPRSSWIRGRLWFRTEKSGCVSHICCAQIMYLQQPSWRVPLRNCVVIPARFNDLNYNLLVGRLLEIYLDLTLKPILMTAKYQVLNKMANILEEDISKYISCWKYLHFASVCKSTTICLFLS